MAIGNQQSIFGVHLENTEWHTRTDINEKLTTEQSTAFLMFHSRLPFSNSVTSLVDAHMHTGTLDAKRCMFDKRCGIGLSPIMHIAQCTSDNKQRMNTGD